MQSLRERHQERQLFRRSHDGDPRAREELVVRYLPLAHSVARRFSLTAVAADDLAQIASLGLLKAIDRYDPDHGAAFTSFAVPTIVGEIQRHLRDHTWIVRPPRDLQEQALRVRTRSEALAAGLGRAPTARELAADLDLSVERVLETLEALAGRYGASLDHPLYTQEGDEGTLGDTLGDDDPALRHVEDAVVVDDLLGPLTERDRDIVRLRFHFDLTQSEIGERVGLSQMQVSRILRRAMTELAETAAAGPPREYAGIGRA